jgi:hypothetical protein
MHFVEYFAPSPSLASSEYVVVDLIDHFGGWNVVSEQMDLTITFQSP